MRAWSAPAASSAEGTTTYQPEGKGENGKRFDTDSPVPGELSRRGAARPSRRYRVGQRVVPLSEAPSAAPPHAAPPSPAPGSASPHRRDRILDALGLLASFSAGLGLWLTNRGPASPHLPADAPFWARIRDHLLDGPDAGAWASNALALWLGHTDDLDAHRLPILPYLTAIALRLYPDPALAGHLVNHVLHVLLGPVVFLLGRAWMGRGMALGAALVAVTYPAGVLAADRYGVDPLVAIALPTALLAAEGAARWWRAAPLFGVVVGLAACAHLTTIGVPVAALLLTFLRGAPGWRRWGGALGMAVGTLGGVALAFHDYPTLPQGILLGSLAEGVSSGGAGGAGPGQVNAAMERAWGIVLAGGPAALERVIGVLTATTRPGWLPWAAALWLPWLGLFGFGLDKPPPGPPTRLSRALVPVRGLAVGLPLAGALVPLLAFAAADSPPRYSHNFIPLGVLLVFRGVASLTNLVDLGAARRLPRWPAGLLGLAGGLALAWSVWDPSRALAPLRMPPTGLDLADWKLGTLLRAHFAPGGGASCMRREVAAYAGRVFCPNTPGFTYSGAPEPVRAHLDAECSGEGPVPYVILAGVADGSNDARLRMNTWVQANGTPVATFDGGTYTAEIYAVDRPAAVAPTPDAGAEPSGLR